MARSSPFQRDGDKQWLQTVWRTASDLRSQGSTPVDAWVGAIRQSGIEFGWREFDVLAWAWATTKDDPIADPIPLGLVDLCEGLRPMDRPFAVALDPWANAGSLLAALLDRGIAMNARGATVSSAKLALSSALNLSRASLVCAEPEDWLRTQDKADLIVSVLPWGSRADANKSRWPEISHLEYRLVLAASLCVQRGGRVVMVVPSSFFSLSDNGIRTHQLLSSHGLCIEAALFLPSGALGSTSRPGYAAVLGSGNFQDIFVGELRASKAHNVELTDNLRARRSGATPALGRLIQASDFRGFPQLLDEEEETRRQSKSPYKFRQLSEVALYIEKLPEATDEQRQGFNCLFLNIKKPDADATTDLSNVQGDEKDWVVVSLNADLAIAHYVCRFLNSDNGRLARKRSMPILSAMLTGALLAMPFIVLPAALLLLATKKGRHMGIGLIQIAAPPVEDQRTVLQIDARLTELRDGAETLREKLWSGHEEPEKLARRIETIGSPAARAESVEDWMRDLPFPLASILRRHQRYQRDPEKAFHVLVHFFEAFAEFWATILLSALDRAKEIPSQTTKDVREYMAGKVLPIETSSLGTWNALGGKLASHFRRKLEDQKGKAEAPSADPLDYFATRDHGVVERLLDRQISAILQQVGQLRNQGQAHGGVIGNQLAEQLHSQALALLTELRRVISPVFRSWRLLRPTSGKNTRTVHHYQCDVLMGSDPQFEIESVELEEIAYDGELHLIGSDRRALLLLPLVRMAPPQGSNNACYFYSRRDGETARFVSYHQETEATELNKTPLDFLTRWNRDPEPGFPAE